MLTSSRVRFTALALNAGLLAVAASGCDHKPAAAQGTAPRASAEPLGYTKVLQGVTDIDAAEQKVRAALKAQGFGIITRIDVRAVMKKKLGKDTRPYRILGACNPGFAHKAIELDPQMGLLLPCKALVYQRLDGKIVVSLMRPKRMFTLVKDSRMKGIADQVDARFRNAFGAL